MAISVNILFAISVFSTSRLHSLTFGRQPCFTSTTRHADSQEQHRQTLDGPFFNYANPPSALRPSIMASKSMGDDLCAKLNGDHWRVWSVADELEKNGLSSEPRTECDGKEADNVPDPLTKEVALLLREWGKKWAGQPAWQTLLNKRTLLHEAEESIVALRTLIDWLDRRQARAENDSDVPPPPPVTMVDVCCGKGILSMLASYILRGKTSTHVANIIMLDKQKDINWNHIVASNECAAEEGRPMIEAWGDCNLHEIDEIVDKFEQRVGHGDQKQPLALVGIHLCKMLSPSFVGVVNSLGPEQCPFVCLAPCCLPRVVTMLSKADDEFIAKKKRKRAWSGKDGIIVSVRTHETPDVRHSRLEANEKRKAAFGRSAATKTCYLCKKPGHPIHKCQLLPTDENERLEIFSKASAEMPCWKCGEVGHTRANCLSEQKTAKPSVTLPPVVDLDVSTLMEDKENEDKGPFEKYCDLLATSLERKQVNVHDVGLVNNSAQHDNVANKKNWNRDRKAIYIVATSD